MLKDILDLERRNFEAFTRQYPGLHASIDAAATKIIETGFYITDRLITRTAFPFLGQMLLNTNRWVVAAVIRLILRDYEEGLTLIRMACEHARDLAVLAHEPLLFPLWKLHRTSRDS